MKIGISSLIDGAPGRDFTFIRDVAVAIEELGFASFRAPDHVAVFRTIASKYPYSDNGSAPLRERQGVLAPLMVLQAVASVTSRIRLGTAVEVIPLREPIARAKDIATLDVLSEGRVDYGVGVGWMREEFEACGIDFATRGRRADEFIDACSALWAQEEASFAGEHFRFADVIAYPKPVQTPRPPVLVGGDTKAALRRAAVRGDGWYGWNLDVDGIDRSLEALDALLSAASRRRAGFRVLVGVPFSGADALAAYAGAARSRGVDELVIGLGLSRERWRRQLEDCAQLIERV